ncbi:MAG: histidine kinase, partial [Firmicutes bacterium]|nr:histidine kinase [Bacillota bacterium]
TGSTGIGPFDNRAIFTTLIIITSWAQFIRLVEMSKYQAHQSAELVLSQEELRDTRISMMMSQIQPHFLYNALNTIQYQCQVDGEQAAKTVESFSKYLRGNMDSLSQTEPIPLSQELKHLENYLAIERLRFPDIQYVYKLKASDFGIPPLTIQPLVENSIRYGVRAMEEGGTITIESWEDEHNYYARVSDNGVGFDLNQKKNDGRSHVGMQNIKSRVQSMCGGHVEIESKIGAGTRSTIVIPKGGKKR